MTGKRNEAETASSRALATRIAEIAWQKKGDEIVVLDLTDCAEFTDYFVLITAEIDQHLKAIADNIIDDLKKAGSRPHHVEGMIEMRWILIDYVDVVVHLQLPDVRDFYQLEALWGEAAHLELNFESIDEESSG